MAALDHCLEFESWYCIVMILERFSPDFARLFQFLRFLPRFWKQNSTLLLKSVEIFCRTFWNTFLIIIRFLSDAGPIMTLSLWLCNFFQRPEGHRYSCMFLHRFHRPGWSHVGRREGSGGGWCCSGGEGRECKVAEVSALAEEAFLVWGVGSWRESRSYWPLGSATRWRLCERWTLWKAWLKCDWCEHWAPVVWAASPSGHSDHLC